MPPIHLGQTKTRRLAMGAIMASGTLLGGTLGAIPGIAIDQVVTRPALKRSVIRFRF